MLETQKIIDEVNLHVDRRFNTLEDKMNRQIFLEEHRLRDIDWVAEYCDVHPKTIRYRIKHQNFPFCKTDANKSDLKFRKVEVDQWIQQNMKIS